MLLVLQFICLCGLALGQFYNPHPLMATDGMGSLGLSYSPGSSGESETLPISQDELAQLMAQSLASSSGGFGHQPPARYQHSEGPSEDSGAANYEGDDGGSEGGIAHNQPEEYGHDSQSQYGQQDAGEASPYQQHEGHGAHGAHGAHEAHGAQGAQGAHGQQGDSHYQPPQEPHQNYGENSGGYQSAPPTYQEGSHYQSGQYPDSQSSPYGSQSSHGSIQESQPGSYEGHRGSQYGHHSSPNEYSPRGHSSHSHNPYNPQSGYQSSGPSSEYGGSGASPQDPRYSQESDSTYSAPGSGYADPGSDSFSSYNINHAPPTHKYRS